MPVFMAATPDFVDKNPATIVAYLQGLAEVARDFKNNPAKVSDVIYSFFTSKGYSMSRTSSQGPRHRRRRPRLAVRARGLHAEGGRGAAAREEDRGDARLEEGATAGPLAKASAWFRAHTDDREDETTARTCVPASLWGLPTPRNALNVRVAVCSKARRSL